MRNGVELFLRGNGFRVWSFPKMTNVLKMEIILVFLRKLPKMASVRFPTFIYDAKIYNDQNLQLKIYDAKIYNDQNLQR
jgi:hypothetical protein